MFEQGQDEWERKYLMQDDKSTHPVNPSGDEPDSSEEEDEDDEDLDDDFVEEEDDDDEDEPDSSE